MAVWIDPVIEYIVREAHHDMGSFYNNEMNKVEVFSHLTDQTPLPCLLWNEGDVVLEHTMEIQGAQVATTFDVQVVGLERPDVGRTLFDFENALIGVADAYGPAHHNVAGELITQSILEGVGNFDNMGTRYKDIAENRPGVGMKPNDDPPEWPANLWFPTHQVERVTVEGQSISL